MDIKYKRQIRNLLFEIVYISFILVFLTCFWYLPRKNMEQKRGDLGYQVQGISTLQVTDQVQSREITVDNQDGKGDLMLLFQEDNGNWKVPRASRINLPNTRLDNSTLSNGAPFIIKL